MKHRRRQLLPVPVVVMIDILLIGVGLVVFALFHHVIPRKLASAGIQLPLQTQMQAKADESRPFSPQVTGSGGESLSDSPTSFKTGDETQSPWPTTAEISLPGIWRERFAGQFTDGEVLVTDNSYQSGYVHITIKQGRLADITYYVADIYLADLNCFRTAFADDTFGIGYTDTVLDLATKNQAIVAMTGDYYGVREQSVVIRNGQLYRESAFDDVLVMHVDGSMQTYTAEDLDLQRIRDEGAWQAWSFGPSLLDNGQAIEQFDSKITRKNPRSAVGYYEPGHYCFVLVDGRQPEYSVGMSLPELSALFEDLGCVVAYNLDGGQSSVLTFMDQTANQPYKGGRPISDILYIADEPVITD